MTGYILEINDGTEFTSTMRQLSDVEIITGEWTTVLDATDHPEITSFEIDSLSTGQLYRFRYKSLNYNGESDYSNIIKAYACDIPARPEPPVIVDISLTSVTLQWTPPSDLGGCDPTGYKL